MLHALLAQTPPATSAGTEVPADHRSFSQKFFAEYHGNLILGSFAGVCLLAIVKNLVKSQTSQSKLGEGLPVPVRQQLKVLEDAGNLAGAGDILFQNGRYDEAAELYGKAEDWVRAGESFDKAGNVGKAAMMFKRGNAVDLAAQAYIRRGSVPARRQGIPGHQCLREGCRSVHQGARPQVGR